MNPLQNSFVTIEQMKDTYLNRSNVSRQDETSTQPVSFEQMLLQASERATDVTFSKHANERLASRNIQLDAEQMTRLHKGIEQAKEKRINESLVMMDNIAFIVNIKNNTVVTAMDQNANDSNVFTNIDGAVIV